MKSYILSFVFAMLSYVAIAQKTSNLQQEIFIGDSSAIVLEIDSTKVKIKHWDAKGIKIQTQVAYEEKDIDLVTGILRADGFDLDVQWSEEEKSYRLSPKVLDGLLAGQQPFLGAFYTIYLPKTVENVVWIADIRMN